MQDPHQLPQYMGPNDPHQPAQRDSNLFSMLAIVLGVIAVIFFPIVFGVGAIILGAIAKRKQERPANIGLVVAIVGTIAGFILGAIVYSNTV